MDSTYYGIVLLLELKLILVCAIVLARLCHVDVTVVPIRWHSCAKPLAQPFPIEETTVPSKETTIP